MPNQLTTADRAEFADGRYWRRSERGNLFRAWESRTLIIFCRPGRLGHYSWIIRREDIEAQFSPVEYPTEAAAMKALGMELGVGE